VKLENKMPAAGSLRKNKKTSLCCQFLVFPDTDYKSAPAFEVFRLSGSAPAFRFRHGARKA
jgi:hypothetical protein